MFVIWINQCSHSNNINTLQHAEVSCYGENGNIKIIYIKMANPFTFFMPKRRKTKKYLHKKNERTVS